MPVQPAVGPMLVGKSRSNHSDDISELSNSVLGAELTAEEKAVLDSQRKYTDNFDFEMDGEKCDHFISSD